MHAFQLHNSSVVCQQLKGVNDKFNGILGAFLDNKVKEVLALRGALTTPCESHTPLSCTLQREWIVFHLLILGEWLQKDKNA